MGRSRCGAGGGTAVRNTQAGDIPFGEVSLAAAVQAINAGQKPLALYVYGKDQGIIERILSETASGGACVNMSMMHYAHNHLPFGGVNNSGMGAAHGIFGFREFSHQRAVLSDQMSVIPMLFPPYTAKVKRLVALTLRFFV